MSTPNSNPAQPNSNQPLPNRSRPPSNSSPPDRPHRRRLADQIANQLLTARLLGGPVRFIQRHRSYLGITPPLHDILTHAPGIAAAGDPLAVRAVHTPSGAVAVIRLHSPEWSLILSGGRPLPDWILAVHDHYPLHLLPPAQARPGWLQALDLNAEPASATELTLMCRQIHAALSR